MDHNRRGSRIQIIIIAVIIGLFSFMSIGCNGGGGGGGDGDGSTDGNGESSELDILLDVEGMVLALDPTGNSITHASTKESNIADIDGVIMGDFDVSPAGWITVHAIGYASGYAEQGFSMEDVDIYETRLTNFQHMINPETGMETVLKAEAESGLSVEATLPMDSFSDPLQYVGLCTMDPLDVGPLFEPLSTGEDLSLRFAFGLQAHDDMGDDVSPVAGTNIGLVIDDQNVWQSPVLAYFNPESGAWQVITDACNRVGDNLTCTVTNLSPLFGVFEPGEVDYFGTHIQGQSHKADIIDDNEELDTAWKEAFRRVQKRFKEIEAILIINPAYDYENDTELNDALENFKNKALEYANKNQNEKGKFHLVLAQDYLQTSGRTDLANQVGAEAIKLADKLGKDLLENGKCGRMKEMLRMVEQLQKMGGDQKVEQDLKDKCETLLAECDLWDGVIRVWLYISNTNPLEYSKISGPSSWWETHKIRIATHAKTLALSGEDYVTISFPEITYEKNDEGCLSSSITGNNEDYDLDLQFSGTFDGTDFSVSDLVLATYSNPMPMKFYQNIQVPDPQGGCFKPPGYPIEYNILHTSVLVNGFSLTGAPPITLQEMLDNGTRSINNLNKEVISGNEAIINPTWDTGLYPIEAGRVIWTIFHDQKLIPLE